MTRRSTRSIARLALIVLVGVLAVLGGRQIIRSGDAPSSSPTAVLATAANHASQAVADRPASRTSLFALAAFLLSLAALAISEFDHWTAVASTDRRALATTLGLQHRRRGPPHAPTV